VFSLQMKVVKKEWMDHPEKRWNEGLNRAGYNFRVMLSRPNYPPQHPGSRYIRTYLTADKANFNVVEPGKIMEFGSTHYLPYLLFDGMSHSALWPGKKEEIIRAMKMGFKDGIVNYEADK
jgi:hypothetical protein